MTIPTVNALLNSLSFVFLVLGFIAIKRDNKSLHIKYMAAALTTSALFLICYLYYHYQVGSVPYLKQDWTRPLYFAILIPHIILAALMVPFIGLLVYHAIKKNFEKHKRIARFVWPVWVFVSLSGIFVYVMLYLL